MMYNGLDKDDNDDVTQKYADIRRNIRFRASRWNYLSRRNTQIYAEKDKVTQKSQIYAESLLGKDIYLYCSFISAYFCVFLRDINIICVREDG